VLDRGDGAHRGGSARGYDMIYDIVTLYSDTELLVLCFLKMVIGLE
jgi:hypothetical protein